MKNRSIASAALIGLIAIVAVGVVVFHGGFGMSGMAGRMGSGMGGMMMRGQAAMPPDAPAALSRHGCMACHALHHGRTGPAFAWVAWRYVGKPDAHRRVAAFIEHGGRGPWGGVMPNLNVPSGDAMLLSQWILTLPPQAPPGTP